MILGYILIVIIETIILCKFLCDKELSFNYVLLSFLLATTVFVIPVFCIIGFIQNLFQKP